MELHEPIQHRAIRHPTFLHLTHSFQEKLFLAEVDPRSALYRLLAGLRIAETPRVMTIEPHTVPYPELTFPYLILAQLLPKTRELPYLQGRHGGDVVGGLLLSFS